MFQALHGHDDNLHCTLYTKTSFGHPHSDHTLRSQRFVYKKSLTQKNIKILKVYLSVSFIP